MPSERIPTAATPSGLAYLPPSVPEADRAALEELSELALRQVEHDASSTVSSVEIHAVAQTLLAADCDTRTMMIFFMSLLDEDVLSSLSPRYSQDLLDAARNASIIRLLSSSDNPKHPAIRKVLLRQLVLKVTHDVRVILVKIAGRLVRLRNAKGWPEAQRKRLAQEALDVVVPWCDALGLEAWRQELQELSFQYLNPEGYNYVLSLMSDHRDILHEVKDQVMREIHELLERLDVEATASGRVKTHYAVYRKMQTHELQYDEIQDRIGIRILTKDVFDCYYIQLAIEEELGYPRRRVTDYIANPGKPYNYQSLHLNVVGPKDIIMEIQIRTYDMHIQGEYGMAAHWKMYGGGSGADSTEDTKFAFLRTQASRLLGDPMDYLGNTLDELLYNNAILPIDTEGYLLDPDSGERVRDSRGQWLHYRDAHANDQGYVTDPHTDQLILSQSGDPIWHQTEVLPDRVIAYTPNGDLKSLPHGATALDFAYYIHENVGHTCIGARVNGKIERLDYTLQLGDKVEIITRNGTKPSMDWLYNGYAKTRRAHDKIRRFFREKSEIPLPDFEDLGRSIAQKRLSAHRVKDLTLDVLAARMKRKSEHDLLEALGSGEISILDLDQAIEEHILTQLRENSAPAPAVMVSPRLDDFALPYTQAGCCLPLPGDETVSYISHGRGFVLHRADCRNVGGLDAERVSPFYWPDEAQEDATRPRLFATRLLLLVMQPTKTVLLAKEVATMYGVLVDAMRVQESREFGTRLEISARVTHKHQLDRMIRKLNMADDILMVRRVMG